MKLRILLIPMMVLLLEYGGCDFGAPLHDGNGGGTETEGLHGTVVNPQGRPVAGALVKAFAAPAQAGLGKSAANAAIDSARTDADGRFAFIALPGGRYNLQSSFQSNGTTLAFLIQGVIYGGGKVNLGNDTLKVTGSLSIQIHSDGAALGNAICLIPGSSYQATSDGAGNCLLAALPPGAFQLQVSYNGMQVAVAGDLSVLSGLLSQGGLVNLINGMAEASYIGPGQHFGLRLGTTALWTFNNRDANGIPGADAGPYNLVLGGSTVALEASPYDSAAVFNGDGKALTAPVSTALTVAATGKVTYEARVFLSQYPSAGNQDARSTLIGAGGFELQIGSNGELIAAPQRITSGGSIYSFNAASAANAVPLDRWVDVAVALDNASRQCYGYIDGQSVRLYGPATRINGTSDTDAFLASSTSLLIGRNANGLQPFVGKIDELRISNDLVLGKGSVTITPSEPRGYFFDPPVLVSPANLATGVSIAPTLIWSHVSGATHYHVQISMDSGFSEGMDLPIWPDTILTGGPAGGLMAGTTYFWRVSGGNDSGSGAYSTVRRFTTAGASGGAAAASLVSYWDFEEGSGTQVLDKSGHGHSGTISGTPVWTGGVRGGALYFDGGTKVSVPFDPAFNLPVFSLAAWVKTADIGADQCIICRQPPSGSHSNYRLMLVASGKLEKWGWPQGTPVFDYNELASLGFANDSTNVPASPPVENNVWHFIAGSYKDRVLKIYVDGKLNNQYTVSEGDQLPYTDGTEPLFIGQSNYSNGSLLMHGWIDEARVYSGELTAAQVDSLYHLATAPAAGKSR